MVHIDQGENAVDFLLGVVFAVDLGEPLEQLIVLQVAVLVHVQGDEHFLQTTLLFLRHHVLHHH